MEGEFSEKTRMMKTLLFSTLLVALYGGELVKAEDYNKGKWLSTVAYFNKLFPNNNELKIATILTKAENWPALSRAHKEAGYDSSFEKFPEALKKINQTLYESLKSPFDKLSEAYKTLDADEKKPIDTLSTWFKECLAGYYVSGQSSFWRDGVAAKWKTTYMPLSNQKKEKIRSKFPFLVWLTEYWGDVHFSFTDDEDQNLVPIFRQLVQSGALDRVFSKAGPNPDYQKLMDALKSEVPSIHSDAKRAFEKMHKAFEPLPPKAKEYMRKNLEWVYENRDQVKSGNILYLHGLKPKVQELINRYYELSESDRKALRDGLPFLFKFFRGFMELSTFKVEQ